MDIPENFRHSAPMIQRLSLQERVLNEARNISQFQSEPLKEME